MAFCEHLPLHGDAVLLSVIFLWVINNIQSCFYHLHQIIPPVLPHRLLLRMARQAHLKLEHFCGGEALEGHQCVLAWQLRSSIHLRLVDLWVQILQEVTRLLISAIDQTLGPGTLLFFLKYPQFLAHFLEFLFELRDLPLEAGCSAEMPLFLFLQQGLVILFSIRISSKARQHLAYIRRRRTLQQVSKQQQYQEQKYPQKKPARPPLQRKPPSGHIWEAGSSLPATVLHSHPYKM